MNSKQMGKQGEQLFQQIMERKGYTVKDVSTNSQYWDKDIDFIVISSTSGLERTFEIKWDSRINNTNNLYLEMTNIHSKGGKGWFNFCQADYLAYGDSQNGCFYVISLLDLRERVRQLPYRGASCGQDSTGILVSLNDIADIVKLLQF